MIDPSLRFLLDIASEHLVPIAVASKFEPKTERDEGFAALKPDSRASVLDSMRPELVESVGRTGTHSVKNLFGASPRRYEDMAGETAKGLDVAVSKTDTVEDVERKIIEAVLERIRRDLGDEKLRQLADSMAATDIPGLKGEDFRSVLLTGGAIGGAQLSGFGVYMAATTALSAISGALGITLPFALYAGVSSAISVLIGPVGWIGLGGAVVYKFGKPSQRRVLGVVLAVAAARGWWMDGRGT
jgi:uncharacterized protein YaaW (UPF0174 family)